MRVAPRTAKEQLQWMEGNRDLLTKVANSVGINQDPAVLVEEYLAAIRQTAPGSDFDDLSARNILQRVLEEVEQACKKHNIPTRGGIAYGVSHHPGISLGQRP